MKNALVVVRGDTKSFRIIMKDKNNNPLDLTNITVFFTVKKNKSDTDDLALIKKKVTVHTDAVNGITQIDLTSTDTDLQEGVYWWDIQLVFPDGKVFTPVIDKSFIILSDITRRTA